jgi:hypothetical protein
VVNHWIFALVSLGSALGCTVQSQRREKVARARSEALERDLKASEDARQKAETKSGALQTALDDLNKENFSKENQLSTLEANLKTKEEELARLNAAQAKDRESSEEFKAQLAALEKARDDAMLDLAAARKQEKNAKDSLDQQERRVIQMFLENPGPDTLFVSDAGGISGIFQLDGRQCAVVFDVGARVEILRGPAMEKLPSIQSYKVLPMRVSYTKMLVCRNVGTIQVGRETGHLVRAQSIQNPRDRKLIAARDQGMCDNRSGDIAKASVFGQWKYQVLEPYLGDVDGIETLDILRSSGDTLRLHTSSGVIGVSSCAEAQEIQDLNSVAVDACKILMGAKGMESYQRTEGCFTEKKEGDNTSLVFHP